MSQAQSILADKALLTALQQLVHRAGQAIMQVYAKTDFGIEHKQDSSPVTAADLAAHNVLVEGLARLTPDIAIVSEEDQSSLQVPHQHLCYWLIDPLDGTKEFIQRNGQFTVNLALIENHQPSLGLVSTPVDQTLYWGGKDLGAWRAYDGQIEPIQTQFDNTQPIRVVASKSHLNKATAKFIAELGETQLIQAGSSLKFLRIAEGQADIYPRLAPTCEWDTAAAQAILEGAGGAVLQTNGQPVQYGKADILNPYFIAYNQHPSL
ncbi:MAG: 3'(2'),5'-bisphosphate nucleotidase CysQ [Gammaproteobacteria bacterium]|jgi:3'(2'), 5'-bisphosphate nucleotidase|nr:3'(2'),5'-bisphosphate nucleotidase CysQ [Gammaproteobacteria bacterium]